MIRSADFVLSANDLFKSQYQKVLRWSLLAAIVITALVVWLMPAYKPNPYVLRDEFFQIEDFEVIEELELPSKPKIKAPVIVREVEPVDNQEDEEFELPETFEFFPYQGVSDPAWQEPLDNFSPASSNPVLTFFSKPDYPEIARRASMEGVVIIKVLVGKNGSVLKTMVLQGVNPILDKAAADAARKCKFKAGTQRSVPVKAWMAIPYSFRLN